MKESHRTFQSLAKTRPSLAIALLLAYGGPAALSQPRPSDLVSNGNARSSPGTAAFFETKIRPVLAEKCFSCHSARAKKVQGRLKLDSREALQRGGAHGPVVMPGEPGAMQRAFQRFADFRLA